VFRSCVVLAFSIVCLGAPAAASACAVSRHLPADILAADAAAQTRAWEEAPLVYVARITGVLENGASFRLEPVRVLKGEAPPQGLEARAMPFRGQCLFYHGFNFSHGARVDDEFVVYASTSAPTSDSRMLIVSPRMLGDPATRAALATQGDN
jgi:hypothetical protein